ncbi:uncharacterized protein LOC142898458 isoform X2 [Nelusetta ayraudi]|uniref:uncharacterized protein LOC142898458 isoform X2 n=1 Tax=Nelusetta ayraudi TaxID=303726 RepID=UPI003F70A66C
MDLWRLLCWRDTLLLLLMPCGLQGMSVYIINQEPVYVILTTKLELRARIVLDPKENISSVTWGRRDETGVDPQEVTLATCPGRNLKCHNTKPNIYASFEGKDSTLKVDGFNGGYSGVYALTVTDQNGAKTTGYCIVRMYEAVHHVSVSINVSHSSLVCGEAWGTEPHFSWLYERVAITSAVGTVSKDGTTLYVTKSPFCGQFTCMVSNKMGHSTATYTAEKFSVWSHQYLGTTLPHLASTSCHVYSPTLPPSPFPSLHFVLCRASRLLV